MEEEEEGAVAKNQILEDLRAEVVPYEEAQGILAEHLDGKLFWRGNKYCILFF